jgi:hypothetical protein
MRGSELDRSGVIPEPTGVTIDTPDGVLVISRVPSWTFCAMTRAFQLGHHPGRLACQAFDWPALESAACWATHDRLAGFAVTRAASDGAVAGLPTLVGLHSHVRGRGRALVRAAVAAGALALECFALSPPNALYLPEGFVVTHCSAFDPELAPVGWDALDSPLFNQPHYLEMRRVS